MIDLSDPQQSCNRPAIDPKCGGESVKVLILMFALKCTGCFVYETDLFDIYYIHNHVVYDLLILLVSYLYMWAQIPIN